MTVRNRLRNSLIRKIQRLSTDKLAELNNLVGKIEDRLISKEKTLKLAGSWKDLEEGLFVDLTSKLHSKRANDRQIN